MRTGPSEREARGSARVPDALAYVLIIWLSPAWGDNWLGLAQDGIHDPANPALDFLQEPQEALSRLPSDTAGNRVDWVRALRHGYIEPRTHIHASEEMEELDSEILMTNTGETAYVLFPHGAHTEWLDCTNCHEQLFASKAGATPMDMPAILSGEYCGRCHGSVAFPLTECDRCHSVPPDSPVDARR